MIRISAAGLALAVFAGCNTEKTDDRVTLEWSEGQTWHLATSYRMANIKGENTTSSLDGTPNDPIGEHWSDEVVWNYQVIEHDFVPSQSDELYEFAATPSGLKALTVVRAYVDLTVADVDSELVEADPVVYLVFHADRDRLAGIVQYSNIEGERLQQAWSSKDLGKSYSALSQSMLTSAPTYLAPFGATYGDKETRTEHGHWVNSATAEGGAVDIVFDDEIGGGDVATRYEPGQPWPTWTVTDNVESRLLSEADVSAMRVSRGNPFGPPPPVDYDYRAALAASIDIDTTTTLDEQTLSGGFSAFSPDGYQPWNGYWWPLSDSELVFGYKQQFGSQKPTFSDRVKDEIVQLKTDMDNLNEELRELDKNGSEYQTKLSEYQSKNQEVVTKLVSFYDNIRAGIDGGTITVANGQITHTVDGWSYDLDDLSPFDKIAVALHMSGRTDPNPFYIPAWELLNQYNPAGGGWWGHCNGWAAAAILTKEPTQSVFVDVAGNNVEFTTGDLKGLLTETHYSTVSQFYGKRYYKDGDDLADLTPAAFTKLVTFYFRDQQVPLVFDTTAGDQVWNFPAYGVEMYVNETTPGSDASLVNVNTASKEELISLPGIGDTLAARIIEYREYYGPFQTIESLTNVSGIGSSRLNDIFTLVTVDPEANERTFAVQANVHFATDGVYAMHVDNGSPAGAGFVNTYNYTLTTDKAGTVISGVWEDINEHPDFAWVPYNNPSTAGGRTSENPYLRYDHLQQIVGDFDRH
ncbi:MAG: ComEA family DNA-binding protein [Myxococcota bacterium]